VKANLGHILKVRWTEFLEHFKLFLVDHLEHKLLIMRFVEVSLGTAACRSPLVNLKYWL